MKDKERESMTPGDAAFLDRIVERTRAAYAAMGKEHVLAHVECRDGRIVTITAPEIGDDSHKEAFVSVVRHKSLREGSVRSAIVAESWTIIDQDEETMMEVGAYIERGGRVSQHPLATEMVTVTIESEVGITFQMLTIDRRVPRMTILEPKGGPVFMPAADGYINQGVISGFHLPLAMRIRPDVMAWAAWMDANAVGAPWFEAEVGCDPAESVN